MQQTRFQGAHIAQRKCQRNKINADRIRIMAKVSVVRAGLKPMQPMRLHWALRLWGPRAMCLDSCSFLPNTPCAQIQ